MVLIVGEVYMAQWIEYFNGQFVALTKDGIPAKTVLAFMVQLTLGKYKDVMLLIPITKLDSGRVSTIGKSRDFCKGISRPEKSWEKCLLILNKNKTEFGKNSALHHVETMPLEQM